MISVVVPVYKVEPFLHRCVESILGQSYPDFELILVDDGSPDNCGAICEEYAAKDARVHVIHQENGGLSAARNAGIEWALSNSDSQWLTFIDSDDWVHKDYLRILLEAAQSQETAIAMCGLVSTDSAIEDVTIKNIRHEKKFSEQAFSENYVMCMTACCKLYKKQLFLDIRFPVGKLHEDAYITHILAFRAEKVAICDVVLYYYFCNQDSITRVKWSERRLDQIEAHEQRLGYLKEHGYDCAYRRELEAYVIALFTQAQDLKSLSREDASYLKYLKELRPKLRPSLSLARENGVIPFGDKYLWIYEIAYPVKPIWYAVYLIKKILGNTKAD